MRQILLLFGVLCLVFACNTKQGTGEPPLDNQYNPAEMTVDSVGANTDMKDHAATDSNKTGEPQMSPGASDNAVDTANAGGKTIGADGSVIKTNQDSVNNIK